MEWRKSLLTRRWERNIHYQFKNCYFNVMVFIAQWNWKRTMEFNLHAFYNNGLFCSYFHKFLGFEIFFHLFSSIISRSPYQLLVCPFQFWAICQSEILFISVIWFCNHFVFFHVDFCRHHWFFFLSFRVPHNIFYFVDLCNFASFFKHIRFQSEHKDKSKNFQGVSWKPSQFKTV